jgi:methyl-accepting chemotaxis protein
MLDAANDVTTLINQNLDSANQIARTTETLASQADLLVRSVDRFKLDV